MRFLFEKDVGAAFSFPARLFVYVQGDGKIWIKTFVRMKADEAFLFEAVRLVEPPEFSLTDLQNEKWRESGNNLKRLYSPVLDLISYYKPTTEDALAERFLFARRTIGRRS